VIRDTVGGVSLDETAESLDLTHPTVFNLRHKILCCIEQEFKTNPTKRTGICETDETYVLESLKGRKLPANYYRKPRKHGAVAAKRGLSNEYICVCASVTENNQSLSVAVSRATPSKEEILEVFGSRVDEDTLILCEGNKSYDVLETRCRVATSKSVNKVNGFHSFIKERNLRARGFATRLSEPIQRAFFKDIREPQNRSR
jgi:transposase-like protein